MNNYKEIEGKKVHYCSYCYTSNETKTFPTLEKIHLPPWINPSKKVKKIIELRFVIELSLTCDNVLCGYYCALSYIIPSHENEKNNFVLSIHEEKLNELIIIWNDSHTQPEVTK